MIEQNDLDAVVSIASAYSAAGADLLRGLAPHMNARTILAGQALFTAGDSVTTEYFVLDGLMRIYAIGFDGREVTFTFCKGPGILTPLIARSEAGQSFVFAAALASTRVVGLPNAVLIDHMIKDRDLQTWGDTVLQSELVRRARREWSLAALSARERLDLFRRDFPDLEATIPHTVIASYLGVTPVTLSRLRHPRKA